jgi:DNA-directed RNA polymerase specialized sigma subunit
MMKNVNPWAEDTQPATPEAQRLPMRGPGEANNKDYFTYKNARPADQDKTRRDTRRSVAKNEQAIDELQAKLATSPPEDKAELTITLAQYKEHFKKLKNYEAMIEKHDEHAAATADADAEASAALQEVERHEQQQAIESQQRKAASA